MEGVWMKAWIGWWRMWVGIIEEWDVDRGYTKVVHRDEVQEGAGYTSILGVFILFI